MVTVCSVWFVWATVSGKRISKYFFKQFKGNFISGYNGWIDGWIKVGLCNGLPLHKPQWFLGKLIHLSSLL